MRNILLVSLCCFGFDLYAESPEVLSTQVNGHCDDGNYQLSVNQKSGTINFLPFNFSVNHTNSGSLFRSKTCSVSVEISIPSKQQISVVQLPLVGLVSSEKDNIANVIFYGGLEPLFEESYRMTGDFENKDKQQFYLDSKVDFENLPWSTCGDNKVTFTGIGRTSLVDLNRQVESELAVSIHSPWVYQILWRSCNVEDK